MTPEDLVEIEQIKRLKYRYLRCLDQKLWDELTECFEPDATASYGGGAYVRDGREAILEFISTSMGPKMRKFTLSAPGSGSSHPPASCGCEL